MSHPDFNWSQGSKYPETNLDGLYLACLQKWYSIDSGDRIYCDTAAAASWLNSSECWAEDYGGEETTFLPTGTGISRETTYKWGDAVIHWGTNIANFTQDSPLTLPDGYIYVSTDSSNYKQVIIEDSDHNQVGAYHAASYNNHIAIASVKGEKHVSGARVVSRVNIDSPKIVLLSAQFNQASLNVLNSAPDETSGSQTTPATGKGGNTSNTVSHSGSFGEFTLAEFPFQPRQGGYLNGEVQYTQVAGGITYELDTSYPEQIGTEGTDFYKYYFYTKNDHYDMREKFRDGLLALYGDEVLGTDLWRVLKKNYNGADWSTTYWNDAEYSYTLKTTDDYIIRLYIPMPSFSYGYVYIQISTDSGSTWTNLWSSINIRAVPYQTGGTASQFYSNNLYMCATDDYHAIWKTAGTDPITGETHEAGDESSYPVIWLVSGGKEQGQAWKPGNPDATSTALTNYSLNWNETTFQQRNDWSYHTADYMSAEAMCYIYDLIVYPETSDPSNEPTSSDYDNDEPNSSGDTEGTSGGKGDNNFKEDNPAGPDTDDLNDVSVIGTGMLNIYNPTQSLVATLIDELNSNDVWQNIRQFFNGNPMDAFISLHVVPYYVTTGSNAPVKFGSYTSAVTMPTVTTQFESVYMGECFLNIPWASHEYLSYAPHTNVSIYLPFIGVRAVDVNDVMGRSCRLTYTFDVLTGKFSALLQIYHTYKNAETGKSVSQWWNRYCWQGDSIMKYPLIGSDHTAWLNSVISTSLSAGSAFSGFASGNPAQALNGLASVASNAASTAQNWYTHKPEVGGQISTNAGYLSIRQPFFILTEPEINFPENYPGLIGKPSNLYKKVDDLKGYYAKFRSVNIDSISCTAAEYAQISQYLYGGCYI